MSSPNSCPDIDCFALLDDSTAPAGAPRSRLYTRYVQTLAFTEPEQLDGAFLDMQQALQKGLHAVALFPYALGEKMHGIAGRGTPAHPSRILLFAQCEMLSATEVDAWLRHRTASQQPAGIAQVIAGIDETAFIQAIDRIHTYIEAGDTYQVNFTYRLHFSSYGPIAELYRKLRLRQPVPYGALIALPDGGAVVSLSPELFLRHEAGKLIAQPMKGTAQATGDAKEDALLGKTLVSDEKSRAENVMIVDLLRNDLGKVAVLGSVQVPELFDVTRFGGVLQMTSTVTAQLREEVTLADLIRAVYPCGSVTGAPKHRTMQIIRELEAEARGIYTGAIGWFDAPTGGAPIGDFCLSVPIRTLELHAPDEAGLRKGEMGIGAGIVHDSVASSEYAECRLKGRFLTGMPHDFELFETMYATKEGIRHLDRHLQRLRASAAFFGFAWNEVAIQEALRQYCDAFAPDTAYRVRLSLSQQGEPAIQSAPLLPLPAPARLLRASQATDAGNPLLRHKTTVRPAYDVAWRSAERQGAFDALFCNQHGQVTEGGRSSIFVCLDGQWLTPPLSAGVLPGVMRAVLLDDPAWGAKERNISREDLRRAEKVVVCNALRGALDAIVDWEAPPLDLIT